MVTEPLAVKMAVWIRGVWLDSIGREAAVLLTTSDKHPTYFPREKHMPRENGN